MAETNALNDMVSLKPYPNVSAFLSGTKQAPTPKGYVGVAEIAPAQQELRQAQAKAREDIGKADINIEKAKREEAAAKMQADIDVEKESAERIKEMPERMALKAKQEEASALKFMPTKDTAQDIAGLFSLIGIVSMALGGNGRMSGHLALGNMNAMMEGYRKGRTDLNKREAVEFDKNFKAMQAALETLSREYKDALEIEKSDKERGRLERHMALAKVGSPVLKAMEEKLGSVNTNQTIEDLLKDLSNAATMKNNLQKHADDVQARKDAKLGKSQIFTGSDGNTYAYDPFTKKVTPVELPQGVTLSKVGGAGGAKTSAATAGAVERMGVSMSQAADALDILSDMPITTTSPVYGQENFTGLFTAPLSVLNQQISETSAQMMRTNLAGVSRNLASLETGGAATGLVGLTDKIEKGIAIPAGSSTVVALNSLAEMRRIVESSARNALASPNYSESQKGVIRENLDFVRKAIPYTQKEINHAIRATQGEIKLKPGDENLSFTEFMKKYPLTKEEKTTEPIKQTTPKADKSVIDNERSKAKAAIAAGAPEDKVKERFKQKTGEDL